MTALKTWHYVYLARCATGVLYTGCSADPIQRVAQHNSGQGGRRYTARASLRPLELLGAWPFPTRRAALQVERVVKGLSPTRKQQLLDVANSLDDLRLISELSRRG